MPAAIVGAGETVQVWITQRDLSKALSPQASVVFAGDTSGGKATIFVDESTTYQTIDGIGASLTESSAWLIKNKLSAAASSALMTKLFDRTNGIAVSWLRQPMGASDFAVNGNYSYDDMPAGSVDDASLSHFSLAHDGTTILPLLKQALSLNPGLKVMLTPWSPPAWMKSNGSMNGGTLNASAYGAFALYFAKTIKAYEAAGVPIYALTMQNEPLNPTPGYPSMSFPAANQATFLRDNLGPTLAAQGLKTKVLGYDHNWDAPDYVSTLYADSVAKGYLAGSAWHFYGGDVHTMNDIHAAYPDKDVYFTEGSSGTWIPDLFDANITNEINIFRNWAKTYTDWNIALDENRGPTNGGCTTCAALVTVNQSNGSVTYTPTYYAMGHVSKFMVPGARRIASTGYAEGLHDIAFKNADGKKVLVVYNQNTASKTFKVRWGNESFTTTLPASSIGTFTWAGTQAGATVIPAGTRLVASAYEDAKGVRTEATSDAGGGQDVGYTSNGSFLQWKSVDLTNLVGLDARVANGGASASIELHADSPSGALLATLPVSGTGGWQSWATKSAAITGASGVHDLYVVWKGSVNLNWVDLKASSTAQNLLGNPGFESGSLSSWSDWHPQGQANAAAQTDTDTPRTGMWKLTHYSAAAYEQTTYQAVNVPNGTYHASVWVRSGGGQSNLRLEASNFGGAGTLYSRDLGATASSATWTELTIDNIVVTSGNVTIGVHSNAPAGSWAAFDDLQLSR